MTERAKKSCSARFSDDVSDNPQHASDSEGPAEDGEERSRERGLRGRAGVRKGRRKRQEYGSSNESDLDTRPIRQVKSLEVS